MSVCQSCGRDARCDSTDGVLRCVGNSGHSGPHWAPLEGNKALRWAMRGVGCADPFCNRKPNHEMPHRNGRGSSWAPYDEDEEKTA